MSKLSFRARALDASKPMPVFRCEEIPDLPDFAAINRAVPLMPTGMEKEEECEHHLQRAISAQQAYGQTGDLVIPTPEVYDIYEEYERLYPSNYKISRQLIHMQPFAMEQDIPDYDMDSEDEKWVNQQAKKMDLTPLQFEEMMDRLEKGSGQHVVTLKEAKLLLKEDDDLIISVYDYWLNKRLKTQRPLILQVKTEKRDGSTNNNPYVAFRRRTEKMQTRKNRKNDEASYEKMLKLRRDLSRAVTLLEMVKRREKTKREHLHLTVEIFEKRYQAGDFSGHILAEVSALKHTRPAFVSSSVHSNSSQYTINRQAEWVNKASRREEGSVPRKKREYKKRKHKSSSVNLPPAQQGTSHYHHQDMDGYTDVLSSEDETLSPNVSPSDQEDESDPDGPFAFRRKKTCNYHAPILGMVGNWPWCSPQDGGFGDKRYRYCLTSISVPRPRCIGLARRRIGRGGRMLLDRAWTPLDEYWSELDSALSHSVPNGLQSNSEFLTEVKNEWMHFRPQTPPPQANDADGMNDDVDENGPCSEDHLSVTEFSIETFQSHQEELLEMQRRQQERLRQEDIPAADHSLPTSLFTLDSASVQFAVSAVVNTAQVDAGGTPVTATAMMGSLSGATNTTNTITTTCSASGANGVAANVSSCNSGSIPLVNGPTSDSATLTIPSAFVTDFGQPILCTVSSHPSSTTSSSFASTNPISVLAAKTVARQASQELKIAQTAQNSHSVTSDNQGQQGPPRVKVDNLVSKNTTLPMEVT